MKHEIGLHSRFLKIALPLSMLWPWNSGFVPKQGTHRDGWKGWGRCKLKGTELAFCSPFQGRGYSGRQTSKGKFGLRCAEIGQNVVRPKGGEGEKKKRKKSFFFTQRGFFLKTASNYSAVHIGFTPGSFALYLEPKCFLLHIKRKNWGRWKWPRIWWFSKTQGGRKCMTSGAALLGTFYFPQSRQTEEFNQSDVKEGACKPLHITFSFLFF